MIKQLVFFSLLLAGCNECPEKVPPFTMQEFTGRDENIVRRAVYRAKVPTHWKRVDTEGSIADTTKPNVTFLIGNDTKLTVHTFAFEPRISPEAQIHRWKNQLKEKQSIVKSVGKGGFCGLFLESSTVLAWSMQLDIEHNQTLKLLATTVEEEEHFKQMRADYTIKVMGSQSEITKYRDELFLFANSFELIQEIPESM